MISVSKDIIKLLELNDDNISNFTIIAKDKNNNILHTIELIKNDSNLCIKNNNTNKTDVIKEYFHNCVEQDGNFDENLIDQLCAQHSIPKSILKADIALSRQSYINEA